MISICITIKNRSRVDHEGKILSLFPNCIRSIAESVSNDLPCEIVIADWHSDDWPLREWVYDAASPVPVRIIPVDGDFNRGRGRNIAGKAARGKYLFFLDADCLISGDVLEAGVKYLDEGKAYFPVLYSYLDPEHTDGWWRHEGYGNCMVTKEMFNGTDGWPEYNIWGREDDHFYGRIEASAELVREETPGFFHQWHPNDVMWKDRFSERAKEIALEVEQVEVAVKELIRILPESKFILVDDGRFGKHESQLDRAIPFLEGEGVYYGRPADSEAAIKELERSKANGATSIVFTWLTFWWLDFYHEFNLYLEENYELILKNDHFIIFSLNSGKLTTSISTIDAEEQMETESTINFWYYKNRDGKSNFGDLLGKYIVEKLSGKEAKYVSLKLRKPVYVTIGSVLNLATGIHSKCSIWGSGILSRENVIPKGAKIHAVRGPVTQQRLTELGIKPPEAIGDPALLLNLLYQPPTDIIKKQVGIIPHYVDYREVKNKVNDSVKVINLITEDIEKVVDEIVSCSHIISSSLHGVIVAHAYGIPAIWVKFSDELVGDNIKFEDYFRSVGITPYEGENLSEKDLVESELADMVRKYGKDNSIIDFDRNRLLESCPFIRKDILKKFQK